MQKRDKPVYGYYVVGVYLIRFGVILILGSRLSILGFANDKSYWVILGFSIVVYGVITTIGW